MASRKNLKKDIDYLVFELLAECYGCIYENPDMDLSGFEGVINDTIELKEDLLSRISQFDNSSEGKARSFFKTIKMDLLKGLNAGYEKLQKVSE